MPTENVDHLTFDSEPGVYEIFVVSGKTYEFHLPEDFLTPPHLLMSRHVGEEEEEGGTEKLEVFSATVALNKPAKFVVNWPERGGMREVTTPEVASITRIS